MGEGGKNGSHPLTHTHLCEWHKSPLSSPQETCSVNYVLRLFLFSYTNRIPCLLCNLPTSLLLSIFNGYCQLSIIFFYRSKLVLLLALTKGNDEGKCSCMTTEYIIYIEVHTKSATYSSFSPCFSVGGQYFLELIHP